MNVLLLGGTVFLGRHIMEQLHEAGHRVTLFTRGRNVIELPEGVESVIGDREHDLARLAGRDFDVVIDTSGYVPRIVQLAAQQFKDVAHYIFISTVSAYRDLAEPNMTEQYPLKEAVASEDVGQYYGELKAECERVLQRYFTPQQLTIIRPGLIVGPYDPTDRFTYWVDRFARGGTVVGPGEPHPVQWIDVRDLASFIVKVVAARTAGTFHTAGPSDFVPFPVFLGECLKVFGGETKMRLVRDELLLQHHVQPWTEMPLWIPPTAELADVKAMLQINSAKAIQSGLTFRPLSDTLRDTHEWWKGVKRPLRAGLDATKEQAILAQN